MKKLSSLICALIVLTGCTSRSLNLEQTLDEIVEDNLTNYTHTSNHLKKYVSYYVPKNIGIFQQEISSTVFSYEQNKFMMALNVSAILNKGDIDSKSGLDLSNALYFNQGSFYDPTGNEFDYTLALLPLNSNYYIVLDSDYVSFYGYANAIDSIEVINAMTRILKTAVVNTDRVLEDFDRDTVQQSTKIELNLFDDVIPSSGRLSEIVDGEVIEPTPTPSVEPTDLPEDEVTSEETQQPSSNEDIYQESGSIEGE